MSEPTDDELDELRAQLLVSVTAEDAGFIRRVVQERNQLRAAIRTADARYHRMMEFGWYGRAHHPDCELCVALGERTGK